MRLRDSGQPASRDTTALEPPLDRLPRGQQAMWRAASSDSVYRLTWAAEMDWSPEELQRMHDERTQGRATLGNLPLVVISRAPDSRPDSLGAERAAHQQDLVALSHQATHVVATHAGHNIHLEEPQVVIRAIRGLIERVRRSGQASR
jgi:pimeloyl-ACP methyl ester carboxylesterase